MRILFVTPHVGRKSNMRYVRTWQMEPLTIATLAALTPNDVEIEYVDERLGEHIDYSIHRDLVIITVETYTAKRSYEICAECREYGLTTVLGGYHVMLLPQEAQKYGDSIIVGFAEPLWEEMISDAKKGNLKPLYIQDRMVKYPFVIPRRDIFGERNYFNLHCVETGRGCPLTCEFCSITAVTGATHLARPIDRVLEDIKSLKGNNIFLVEDNFVGNKRHAKELLRAMIPLKINWVGQGTLNMGSDEELLELMKASGCAGVLIGFESLKRETLMAMNKPINTRFEYEKSIKQLHRYGIALYGTFIFGYDTETVEDIRHTVEKAIDFGIFMAAFNHLLPFPGTPTYDRLEAEKRLVYDKWWLSPEFRFGEVPFHPKSMSRERLHEECLRARERFYSVSSIVRRGIENISGNCSSLKKAGAYMWINYLLRREVAEKDGLPLGNYPDLPKPKERNNGHETFSVRIRSA